MQAAKAITGDLTKRISSSSAYDGDSTIQQMLELRWQQQQASTSPSQVAGSIALGRQDENSAQSVNGGSLSVGMPARSQLYQALARPPPQSNILNSTFSSNFSSIPNSGDAEGFPLNDMELSPIGTGAGPRTGNVSAGVAMTDSNTVSSANVAPAFTDSFTDDVISKDTSDFFNGGENGRDFNSLATSNADMDGLNVPPLEVMEYRPDSNLQQNPENLLLSQRHDNWFRVVKSEPYLVASNSKMQKSLLSLPPV